MVKIMVQYHTINLIPPRAAYMCQVNRVSIASHNGLSPIRRQAIISTNTGLLWIGLLEETLVEF